jgi:hypothetical protein
MELWSNGVMVILRTDVSGVFPILQHSFGGLKVGAIEL